jgi:putative heme-binding domain-containing protein
MTMYAHHMAKVLAYTGQPDVIAKVFAIMPQADVDQPGQIDYMYALRMIDQGWTPAQKQQLIAWFGKASKRRGGARFSGHVNNIFNAAIDVLDENEKQLAYDAAPLFAPLSAEEIAAARAGGGGGRGGGGRGAGVPPAAAAAEVGRGGPAAPGPASPAAGGARAAGAAPARGGGGGGRGRGNPLDTQERYDNLVFPRGGGPGELTGRGGGPNATTGRTVFEEQCASCHRAGGIGARYAPDLTNLGQRMPRRDILRAIFFPDEQVDPKFRATVLTMRDTSTMRGLVVSETAQAIVLKTADAAEPVTVQKANIASRTTDNDSIMPADLPDTVGDANLAHVTAFLMGGQ